MERGGGGFNAGKVQGRFMKRCSRCGVEKDEREFSKNKSTKDGMAYYCKNCMKQYYQNDKECIKERTKEWAKNNKEKIRIRRREYREKNHEYIIEKGHEYYRKNKDILLLKAKIYHKRNKNIINEQNRIYSAKYYQENQETLRNKYKNYRKKNKEKLNIRRKELYHCKPTHIRNERRKNSKYYIREKALTILKAQTQLSAKDIPEGLVQLKVLQILLVHKTSQARRNKWQVKEQMGTRM
jgi:hypothetical protein